MGLLDRIKDQFLDVIEYVDKSSKIIVTKFQRESGNNELKQGTKVVVRESQAAVFLKERQLADILFPGTYSLDTDNLPGLLLLVYGGIGVALHLLEFPQIALDGLVLLILGLVLLFKPRLFLFPSMSGDFTSRGTVLVQHPRPGCTFPARLKPNTVTLDRLPDTAGRRSFILPRRRSNTMKKLREELEKECAEATAKAEQYQHQVQRLENRYQDYQESKRKKRNHRLITRGADRRA